MFKCRTAELAGVTTIEYENWEDSFIYLKKKLKSAKLRVVWNIEWTNNSKFVNFWNFDNLQNFKYSEVFNIPIWKIPEIFNLQNSENF